MNFKSNFDNRGVTLLIVMMVMSVVLIIANLLIYAVMHDRSDANNYSDRRQAFYVAEAGADLAITQWIIFINNSHQNSNTVYAPDSISISEYLNELDNLWSFNPNNQSEFEQRNVASNPRYELEKELRDNLGLTEDSNELWIYYKGYSVDGNPNATTLYELDNHTDSQNTIVLYIDGKYKDEIYPYTVRLSYCVHGKVFTYKGTGVIDEDSEIPSNSDNDIISFTLTEQTGPATIDTNTHTVTVEVENGTDLTNLEPTIEVSENATISPASGVAEDFTNPVTYTVTAQDGSTQEWTITVTVDIPEGYAWVDLDGDGKFDLEDTKYTRDQVLQMIVNYSTNGELYIPASVGDLNVGNNEININADKGINIGVSLTNESNHNISLNSSSGDVTLVSGVDIEPTHNLSINAQNIYASSTNLSSTNNGTIQLTADASVDVSSATIESSNLVSITGSENIHADGSQITSINNGYIKLKTLNSGAELSLNEAELTSSNYINIESQGTINAQNSKLSSSSNGNVSLITFNNGSDIKLNQTALNSSGKVFIKSQGALYANDASFVSQSNGGTELQAVNDVQLSNSNMPASGRLSISSQSGNLIANSSNMSSTNSTDVNLTSGGDISVISALINASNDLTFTAGTEDNRIYVSGSKLYKNSNPAKAKARPEGVKINGTPDVGSVKNK